LNVTHLYADCSNSRLDNGRLDNGRLDIACELKLTYPPTIISNGRVYNGRLDNACWGSPPRVQAGGGDQLLVLVEVVAATPKGACSSVVLVPVGRTTWFRANEPSIVDGVRGSGSGGGSGTSAIAFDSFGFDRTMVHGSIPSEHATVPLNPTVAAAAHLAFKLGGGTGFKVGFNSGQHPLSTAEIASKLAAAEAAEMARERHVAILARVS
jgi:hypothetical protein